METLPTAGGCDPRHDLNADERFLLSVIIGGSTSVAERIERLESLHARDVITTGEARRIRRAIESDGAS